MSPVSRMLLLLLIRRWLEALILHCIWQLIYWIHTTVMLTLQIFDAPKMTVGFISCVETSIIMMKTCRNKLPTLNSRSFRIEKDHLVRSLQGLLKTLSIIQVKVVCWFYMVVCCVHLTRNLLYLLTNREVFYFSILVAALWNWNTSSIEDGYQDPIFNTSSSSCERTWSGSDGVSTYLLSKFQQHYN